MSDIQYMERVREREIYRKRAYIHVYHQSSFHIVCKIILKKQNKCIQLITFLKNQTMIYCNLTLFS